MKLTKILKLFQNFDASEERVRCHLYEQLNVAHHKLTTKEEKSAIIFDHDSNASFYNIDRFMREVKHSTHYPYVKNKKGFYVNNFRCRLICEDLKKISTWIQHRKDDLRYSPYVELFYQTVLMTGYHSDYNLARSKMKCNTSGRSQTEVRDGQKIQAIDARSAKPDTAWIESGDEYSWHCQAVGPKP